MTDRDHFAAAALTGLLAQGDDGSFSEESYARAAYRWADAMLRERSRSGQNSSGGTDSAAKCTERDSATHDAAPAARASEATASPERVRVRGDAGTGDTQEIAAYRRFVGEVMNWISEATGFLHDDVLRTDDARDFIHNACMRCWDAFDRIAYPTIHGAAPAATVSVESVAPQPTTRGDSDRADKAAPRPSEGTGNTDARLAALEELSALDQKLELEYGLVGNPLIKAGRHTPPLQTTPGECSVRNGCASGRETVR